MIFAKNYGVGYIIAQINLFKLIYFDSIRNDLSWSESIWTDQSYPSSWHPCRPSKSESIQVDLSRYKPIQVYSQPFKSKYTICSQHASLPQQKICCCLDLANKICEVKKGFEHLHTYIWHPNLVAVVVREQNRELTTALCACWDVFYGLLFRSYVLRRSNLTLKKFSVANIVFQKTTYFHVVKVIKFPSDKITGFQSLR